MTSLPQGEAVEELKLSVAAVNQRDGGGLERQMRGAESNIVLMVSRSRLYDVGIRVSLSRPV